MSITPRARTAGSTRSSNESIMPHTASAEAKRPQPTTPRNVCSRDAAVRQHPCIRCSACSDGTQTA